MNTREAATPLTNHQLAVAMRERFKTLDWINDGRSVSHDADWIEENINAE